MALGWQLVYDGKTPPPGEAVAPDERLSWGRTVGLGAQHVVAMFGATFVFPIVMAMIASVVAVQAAAAPLGTPDARLPAAHLAAGLPSDRLHFGLANAPGNSSWMQTSGVPWKYRYQYLSGGVNTGAGWETWNSPPGQFATFYMRDSDSIGAIPVFTYYELLQSLPSTGGTELDRDYSNLNNTSTMKAYYTNFALLMTMAKAFGKPVVVHVEPDLFADMEQKAAGGNASAVSASVASSSYTGLGALPNTFQGFTWALLTLRNAIAPNVILATHASAWASGVDIGLNTDPTLNLAANADTVAAFLNSAGIAANPTGTTFDVVFNDVADRDSGTPSGHWWDRNDTNLPDFKQWLTWITELHAKTARQMVVWQVPVGNQYFDTMNQTPGHYQDNRAEYFFGHITELRNAGIIAKAAETLDEISGGRFVFGLGAGHAWPGQAHAFGLPEDQIFARFEEALEVIVPLMRGGHADFEGTWHAARDLPQVPVGPRPGRIPLMIGGNGPKGQRHAARHADIWSSWAEERSDLGEFGSRLASLDNICVDVGRDPATLGRSAGIDVHPLEPAAQDGGAIAGSAEEIADAFRTFREAGFTQLEIMMSPGTVVALEALAPVLELLDAD